MRNKIYALAILFALVLSIFGSASKIFPSVRATYVEQPITEDTVWTLVDSPFIVSNDIIVYSNATLTIEPGVEVKFGGQFSLIVWGKIFANGTNMPITFTSNRMNPQEGDWNAVVFLGTERSILINCFVKHGINSVVVAYGDLEIRNSFVSFSQNGITAINGKLNVQNTTVSDCSQDGIIANNSQVTVQNSTIMGNKGNGIYITQSGPVTIQLNSIMVNGNGILLAGSQTSQVYISQNKISANTANGIQIDAASHSNIDITYNNVSSNDRGFYISTSASTYLTNNSISYNTIGILYNRGSHTVNYNDIYANQMGMDIELNSTTIYAERNYWGDESGPYHEKLNPTGRGNPVGGNGINVDFIFFLSKSIGFINSRPTAMLLTDKSLIPQNGDIVFFATDSFDADGRVDKYLLNFGDGYSSSWTTLSVLAHRYSLVGTYYANLTVIDDYGTISNVVNTTINVQNLPPLQVNVNLSNTTIHEMEQVSVTIHVTNGTSAVQSASIKLFSITGGNFTQSSGFTNSTGYFVTTFMAPDIAEKTHIRIVVRASRSGYADASAHKYLEISPFISVKIFANPSTTRSEEMSQVSIYVTSNDEPVVNASVIMSASIGRLSSQTGITDQYGAISTVFTGPQTTTSLNAIITAQAMKSGYIAGTGQTTIVVEPKILDVQIKAQPDTTISEAKLNVTIHVEYEMIPIAGASVTVTAEDGNLSWITGTTDSHGNVTFEYTAPPVNIQSMITIAASASKAEYATSQNQIEVTVNPRTFRVRISAPNVQSEDVANIVVEVYCIEDATIVTGANVTISSTSGSFPILTKTTDDSGTSDFAFNAPYTTIQIPVTITVNVTKNGYVNGGNQTEIIVTLRTTPQEGGGWPLTTILLILIPVIIAVVVVALIKFKVISVSSKDEEEA